MRKLGDEDRFRGCSARSLQLVLLYTWADGLPGSKLMFTCIFGNWFWISGPLRFSALRRFSRRRISSCHCSFILRSGLALCCSEFLLFFSSDSIAGICGGTLRLDLLRFSRSRILALALFLDGGRLQWISWASYQCPTGSLTGEPVFGFLRSGRRTSVISVTEARL